MFFILQSVCAFKYRKDPLPPSVSLYRTHWGKKKMFWLVCFSITVGSADSARYPNLSFLPVLCNKTFSASITIVMSSQVQFTHVLPLGPSCWPWHQQPSYTRKGQAELLRQRSCSPSLCLQVLAAINLLQSGNCCFLMGLSVYYHQRICTNVLMPV